MTRLQILTKAVRAAIANKVDRKIICVPAWASTYGVSQKMVRETWEAELTNSSAPGEGK